MISDLVIMASLTLQGCDGIIVEQGRIISCSTTMSTISIPQGVVAIENACFSGQSDLRHITFANTIEFIGDYVLANCPNLKTIKLPKKLRKFEDKVKYGNKARIIYVFSDKSDE